MNKLNVSKVLDFLCIAALFALLIVHLFVCKLNFEVLALSIMGVLVLKLGAYMLKASYYEKEYKKLKDQVRDIIK